MSRISNSILLAAAGATALAAMPAQARDGWGGGRHHDGIDAGDVIAGALIIGGIAAVASAASNDSRYGGRGYGNGWRDRGYGGRHGGYGGYNNGYGNDYGYYQNGYGSRSAVDQCVRAAQNEARRYGHARITDVTSIDRVRGGYEIRGRLVVEQRGYGGRGGYDRYGYNYDRYGDGYDKGRFTCVTRYGGIENVRLGGLRGYY
jgi:hypothetical protein